MDLSRPVSFQEAVDKPSMSMDARYGTTDAVAIGKLGFHLLTDQFPLVTLQSVMLRSPRPFMQSQSPS